MLNVNDQLSDVSSYVKMKAFGQVVFRTRHLKIKIKLSLHPLEF